MYVSFVWFYINLGQEIYIYFNKNHKKNYYMYNNASSELLI